MAALLGYTAFFIQMLVRGWLVQDLTHSPFLVAMVPALLMLPMLVFTLIGGEIADRYDRQRTVIYSDVATLTTYVALTALVLSGAVQAWHVLVLTGLHGISGALQGPARQSLIADLVPQDAQRNAIGMSPAIFNVAQVVGPALGGVLLAVFGVGPSLTVSVVALAAALPVYARLRPMVRNRTRNAGSMVRHLGSGFRYVAANPTIRWFVLAGIVVVLTVNTWTSLFPTLAEDVLRQDAGGLAILTMAVGVGSLAGSFVAVGVAAQYPERRVEVVTGFAFAALVGMLAASTFFALSVVIVMLAAAAATTFMVTNMVAVQMAADPEYRGRVISVRFVMFGLTPVGMLGLGALAEVTGVQWALGAFALLGAALFGLVTLLARAPRLGIGMSAVGEARPGASHS